MSKHRDLQNVQTWKMGMEDYLSPPTGKLSIRKGSTAQFEI